MRTISTALVACALGFVHGSAAEASTETVLYSFCSHQNCTDGKQPRSSVIYVNGILYGTTGLGGNGCCGTLFSLDPNTGVETVLHSFPGSSGDGYFPSADLINVGSTLYGMTAEGGAYGYFGEYTGTVFSFSLTNNAETVLYSFCSRRSCHDGSYPDGGVIVGNKLYGTTLFGGKYGNSTLGGTLFSLNLETGEKRRLQSFQYSSADGEGPEGSPVDVHGTLYGVTFDGGTGGCSGTGFAGCGTVFSFDRKTRTETVLHSFLANGTDGALPYSGVIKVDNKLYGTTFAGGTGNCSGWFGIGCGTVYSINLKTGAEKILYFFCSQQKCTDGGEPYAALINVNGTLYGTAGGGAHGGGAVFSIDPKTGAETVVYSFCSQTNCTDGETPNYASLTEANGTLYGTTLDGGTYNNGTVFSITP